MVYIERSSTDSEDTHTLTVVNTWCVCELVKNCLSKERRDNETIIRIYGFKDKWTESAILVFFVYEIVLSKMKIKKNKCKTSL